MIPVMQPTILVRSTFNRVDLVPVKPKEPTSAVPRATLALGGLPAIILFFLPGTNHRKRVAIGYKKTLNDNGHVRTHICKHDLDPRPLQEPEGCRSGVGQAKRRVQDAPDQGNVRTEIVTHALPGKDL